MHSKKIPAALLLSLGLLSGAPAFTASADAAASVGVTINLIQIGDIHGHLEPRPNLRSDAAPGANEGGLARIAWKIKQIRAEDPQALLFNVGDTIQGSAEALYTEGQVMIDVLDRLDINGFAPGNWEFTYGAKKFFDYFGNGRWGVVAANVYNSATGEHALPPYRILEVKGLRIGVMGLTTERGLPAIPGATVGYTFTDDGREVPEIINILRNVEHVDLVIMLSEFGVAKNVALAEKYPGIDVVLSADMHEETPNLIRTSTGTLVSEVGQDGTQMARYTLTVSDGKLVDYRYEFLPINNQMPQDNDIAKLIRDIRAPFVHGGAFVPHVNPMNGSVLATPIDTVVGQTAVPLLSRQFLARAVAGAGRGFLAQLHHRRLPRPGPRPTSASFAASATAPMCAPVRCGSRICTTTSRWRRSWRAAG
ncbi:MAG: metallophosphoesterase [Desulfomicrobium escambiense]|nr:metallophosphoesterase [Desulfomicrobium escambiense]